MVEDCYWVFVVVLEQVVDGEGFGQYDVDVVSNFDGVE